MKRGLKDLQRDRPTSLIWSTRVTTVTPMKRGLKVKVESSGVKPNRQVRCYNRYPDEKGTESLTITETVATDTQAEVTTVTPMKRGLKESVPSRGLSQQAGTMLQPLPR